MGHPLLTSLNVARGGFEPPLTGPKPAVLPLDDRAITAS